MNYFTQAVPESVHPVPGLSQAPLLFICTAAMKALLVAGPAGVSGNKYTRYFHEHAEQLPKIARHFFLIANKSPLMQHSTTTELREGLLDNLSTLTLSDKLELIELFLYANTGYEAVQIQKCCRP